MFELVFSILKEMKLCRPQRGETEFHNRGAATEMALLLLVPINLTEGTVSSIWPGWAQCSGRGWERQRLYVPNASCDSRCCLRYVWPRRVSSPFFPLWILHMSQTFLWSLYCPPMKRGLMQLPKDQPNVVQEMVHSALEHWCPSPTFPNNPSTRKNLKKK